MIKIDFEINDTDSANFGQNIHLAKGNGEETNGSSYDINNWAVETFLVAEAEAGFNGFEDIPTDDNGDRYLTESVDRNIIGKINGQIYKLGQRITTVTKDRPYSQWECDNEVILID